MMQSVMCPPPPLGEGTGKDGRITKGDVLAFLDRPAAVPAPTAKPVPRAPDAREERVKMTPAAAHHRAAAEGGAEHGGAC